MAQGDTLAMADERTLNNATYTEELRPAVGVSAKIGAMLVGTNNTGAHAGLSTSDNGNSIQQGNRDGRGVWAFNQNGGNDRRDTMDLFINNSIYIVYQAREDSANNRSHHMSCNGIITKA